MFKTSFSIEEELSVLFGVDDMVMNKRILNRARTQNQQSAVNFITTTIVCHLLILDRSSF
jgi:hypothetical protein